MIAHYCVTDSKWAFNTTFPLMRLKAAVVLLSVAEGLRFGCGQCGSFAVFAVYLQFPAVFIAVVWNRRQPRLEPHKWQSGIRLTIHVDTH